MRHYLFEATSGDYEGEQFIVGASNYREAKKIAVENFGACSWRCELTEEEAEMSGLDELIQPTQRKGSKFMRTVKEWIDFLADENYVFGLKLENGFDCPLWRYYPKDEALEKFKAYLEEVVIEAYPMNFHYENGKIGALLIFKMT